MPHHTLDISSDLSRFVKREDLADGPKRFKIQDVTRETFEAKGTSPAQTRIVLTFTDGRKFSLNKTNLKTCAKAFGKDAAKWIGRVVELWFNPEVEMAGQITGGTRIRVPAVKAGTPAPAAPLPPVSVDADEPFDDLDTAMPSLSSLDDDTEVR